MDESAGVPLWVVTSQQETFELSGSGAYVTGTRVAFRTRSGAMGSVFIPQDQYTAASVREKVHGLASQMETVHQMQGEG